MVHRKSEYRLNYKWLPSDVCQDERLKSADYRLQRRRTDFSHHSWGWQLDRCDCEDGDDECDRYLPLPHNRQKHNRLIEQWQKNELVRSRMRDDGDLANDRLNLRPATSGAHLLALPAPPPPATTSDHQRRGPVLTNGDQYDTHHPEPEIVARTNPTDHIGVLRSERGMTRNKESELQYQPRNLDLHRIDDDDDADDIGRPHQKGWDLSARPQSLSKGSNALALAGGLRRNVPVEPRRKKTDITPVEPSIRPGRWRSPSPIKKFSPRPRLGMETSTKPRPPFHSYGWANVVDKIGKQETHNVRSKAPGLRSSASRADIAREASLRHDSVAKDLSHLTRSKSAVNLSTYPINHSSLWMTEYQRNFSKAMRS